MRFAYILPAIVAVALTLSTTNAVPVDMDVVERTEEHPPPQEHPYTPPKCPEDHVTYHVPHPYYKVFGPTDGANNAHGYLTYYFLHEYSPKACAKKCDAEKKCKYFNIWKGVSYAHPKKPDTFTCSIYSEKTDEKTAVNYGDHVNKLKVCSSRGYAKHY